MNDQMNRDLAMENLQNFAMALLAAKTAEELAKTTRITAEERIASLIPTEDVGQKTVTLEDGTKITVKRGLIYKADLEKIETALRQRTPDESAEFPAPIKQKTTHELDVAGYEWYRVNQPTIFLRIVDFVTITPRKVAVTLKPAKEES